MQPTTAHFSDIVEQVKLLHHDEQEELQSLIGRLLTEARRAKIASNFKAAQAEEDKLKFSSSISELKKML
jgi:hypothetical protein